MTVVVRLVRGAVPRTTAEASPRFLRRAAFGQSTRTNCGHKDSVRGQVL